MSPSDQNPDSPNHPDDTREYNPSVTRRVISPVSSEEAIRKELLDNSAPLPQRPVDSNVYSPRPQTLDPALPTAMAASQPPAPQKKIKKHHIVSIVLAVVLLAVIATGVYVYFSRKVSVGDLIREDAASSSYLRPKQWHKVSVNLSSFGDMKGGNGKSTAIVSMMEGANLPALMHASDATYEQLRQQLMTQVGQTIPQTNASSFSGVCKSDMKFTTAPDKTKADTITGLVSMTGICDSTFGTYKVIIRIVGGNDGKVRYIIVGATEAGWSQNEEAYQAILQSVRISSNLSL